MSGRTIRDVLNRLRWAPESGEENVAIGFVVRGDAGERIATTTLSQVEEILPGGVALSGETFIPYHRLRFVRRGGVELWRARARRTGDEG